MKTRLTTWHSGHSQNTRNKLKPSVQSTVFIEDYNDDGKLDIIVGDVTTLDTPLKGITDEEFAEKEAVYLTMKAERVDFEERAEFKKSFKISENTGFVWVYLQK